MATKTLKTVPKISVKIWRPILDKLEAKMEAACLRRDAYLAKVLEVELDWLDQEVSIPNSQASYDYVLERLDLLDRKLVSLALPQEVVARLNEICSRKRIVRDAFFNRVFLLLAAGPKVIDGLLFSHGRGNWCAELWKEFNLDPSFFQDSWYPLESTTDPFWAIRSGLQIFAEDSVLEDYIEPTTGAPIQIHRSITGAAMPVDSLYTIVFERKVNDHDLIGLSCYLPDSSIPGHGAEEEHRAKLDEILSMFNLGEEQ